MALGTLTCVKGVTTDSREKIRAVLRDGYQQVRTDGERKIPSEFAMNKRGWQESIRGLGTLCHMEKTSSTARNGKCFKEKRTKPRSPNFQKSK